MKIFFYLRRLSKLPVLGAAFSFIYRLYNIAYGASIPLCVDIDESTIFPHGIHGIHGIFISKNATLGKGITIFHQVTIGSNQIPSHSLFGAPTIGNNCFISVGAKIIGNVELGSNVTVGPNVSIAKNIDNDVTVVTGSYRLFKSNGKILS
ncbi:hypothetical protein [Vibrio owensii]|uniref:hypothetical protein n=1 Tax=Vibrio owensii TaxID=696485 RepID=UPI00215C7CD9|nr:hypothetical protein [Vibrio owensii]MCR9944547.1 hypothetical protein [Vibrio owensii]